MTFYNSIYVSCGATLKNYYAKKHTRIHVLMYEVRNLQTLSYSDIHRYKENKMMRAKNYEKIEKNGKNYEIIWAFIK